MARLYEATHKQWDYTGYIIPQTHGQETLELNQSIRAKLQRKVREEGLHPNPEKLDNIELFMVAIQAFKAKQAKIPTKEERPDIDKRIHKEPPPKKKKRNRFDIILENVKKKKEEKNGNS